MGTVFSILHVVAAVFLVGPMAILPMTALRSMRTGDGQQVATLAKSTFLFSLLSILVVIFGFGLAGVWHISMGEYWIWLSIVLWLIAILLSLFVVVPSMRKAARQLEGAPAEGAGTPSGYGAVSGTSGIVTLLLLAVVVLMAIPHGGQ